MWDDVPLLTVPAYLSLLSIRTIQFRPSWKKRGRFFTKRIHNNARQMRHAAEAFVHLLGWNCRTRCDGHTMIVRRKRKKVWWVRKGKTTETNTPHSRIMWRAMLCDEEASRIASWALGWKWGSRQDPFVAFAAYDFGDIRSSCGSSGFVHLLLLLHDCRHVSELLLLFSSSARYKRALIMLFWMICKNELLFS